MKALIILGCEGHQQDKFHFCDGVENCILDLEPTATEENYFELIKYLDSVVKIFKQPCNKSHIISNAVYKIYQMGFIDEKLHQHIAYFYNLHKRCGLILSAMPKELDLINGG